MEDARANSSSDDEHKSSSGTRQAGKNYVIDLRSFHKTKLRIETELRNRETCNDIVDAYCSDGLTFTDVNPLLASDGTFPLVLDFYEHDEDGRISTCWGTNCKLTEIGNTFLEDMSGGGATSVQKIDFGGEIGTSLASPTQMHLYPAKSWRAIERY